MDCTKSTLPYSHTGYFSKLVTDYLQQNNSLRSFYKHTPDLQGIRDAIEARKSATDHRQILVDELGQQYQNIATSKQVKDNIQLLLKPTTFTITTAHQPAIFTGTLYFVYKILHAIKLSAHLKQQMPQYDFVPVYYMGSEDADMDELGYITLSGEKIMCDTKQKGAIGRMNTKGLEKMMHRIEGELSVQPHGKELMTLLKDAYLNSPNIETATLKLVDTLFAAYGLVVLIPDRAAYKKIMQPVFEDDLFHQQPSAIVGTTIEKLSQHYKVQANPRAINLFYLGDNLRGRIEQKGDEFIVHDSSLKFSEKELRNELNVHPEKFSPNVILRGMMQETILPNIAFIGGGGETAYWLELREMFAHYKVPYPVLIIRNSFLLIEEKWQEKIDRLNLGVEDIFKSEEELLTALVTRNKNGELKLENELTEVEKLYDQLKEKAGNIDKSLQQHIAALQVKTTKPLQELEKKMLRAEKRKYEAEQRQIHAFKSALFPSNNLQERVENFMPYYAKWGKDFIPALYQYSLALEQEFVVMQLGG